MNELISRDFPRKLKACDTPTLFIVDEAQDLSELYFRLIVKILKDFNPTARLVLLGDRFQMIYGYKGSDWRFFWMADQLLPAKYPRRWKRMPLSTSYRVHNRLAKFVNRCLLKQELIIPSRDVTGSFQPVYCYDNMFSESLWYKLRNMIEGYKDDDVFILGYTIKIKDSPIRKFVNWLSELGHGVHIAEDHEALSTIVMRDKIVFTTFHQSKG
jgi:superfamily I DNA/RNA helicase